MPAKSRAKVVVVQKKGEYFWKLVVRGDIVATSARGYKNPTQAKRALQAAISHISGAPVVDE